MLDVHDVAALLVDCRGSDHSFLHGRMKHQGCAGGILMRFGVAFKPFLPSSFVFIGLSLKVYYNHAICPSPWLWSWFCTLMFSWTNLLFQENQRDTRLISNEALINFGCGLVCLEYFCLRLIWMTSSASVTVFLGVSSIWYFFTICAPTRVILHLLACIN